MPKTEETIVREAEAVKEHIDAAGRVIADAGIFSEDQIAALREAFREIGKALVRVI